MAHKLEPVELQDFIKQAISEIEDAIFSNEERSFEGSINMEIEVEKASRTDGKVKIYVAAGEKQSSTSYIAKMNFKIRPRYSNAEKRNIAEANAGRIDVSEAF